MQALLDHMAKLGAIEGLGADDLYPYFEQVRVAAGEDLGLGWDERFFFVKSGCLRLYFVDQKANEQTVQFAIENWWISASFAGAPSARLMLGAIEDSHLLAIKRANFEAFAKERPAVDRYFRLVFMKMASAWQRKAMLDKDKDLTGLYAEFASKNPAFIQRVPQKYFASYLGCTPEALSRIRAKLARTKLTQINGC